jgi:hypothetical protein
MALTLFLLVLAGVFFWAGFRAPRHSWQYRSRGGFVAMLVLAGFTGYFAWREARTIRALAQLIDPVPEITDVTYVPTAAEVAGISQFLATVPGGRFRTTQEERRDFAERARETAEQAEQHRSDYWLMKTALSPDSVFAFYREAAPRRGWTVETDDAPWLFLSRGAERFVLFVTDDFPRPETKILYALSVGEP